MADDLCIVKNPKGKSATWQHFGLLKSKSTDRFEENVAACFSCKMRVKCSGGTTNLTTHLRRHHPLLLTNNVQIPQVTSPVRKPPLTKQATLVQTVYSKKQYDSSSIKARSITDRIARFLVGNMRPYSLVESDEFRALLAECDGRYKVPSRKTFSDVVIPQMYNQKVLDVKADIKCAEMVALTTDGWSSRACEAFMTITSSHVTDNWELRSYVLQTRALPESHTGDHIAEVLKEAVSEWDIPLHNVEPYNPPIVTDNASNMVKAGVSFNTKAHVMCYAHTLNIAAQKCLKVKRAATLLGRMRKTVAFFHRSNLATHLLKVKADALNLPQHKLKIDVCTRWNSSYDMLERFLEMQVGIFAALRSKEIGKEKDTDMKSFSDEDLSLAEDMLQVLKPLKEITTMLCTEKTPTVSIIMPLQDKLGQLFTPKEGDSPTICEMKDILHDSLATRYKGKETLLNMCTALDPRFKTLPYLNDDERNKVFNELKEEAVRVQSVVRVKVEEPSKSSTSLPDLPSDIEVQTPDISVPSSPKKIKRDPDVSSSTVAPTTTENHCSLLGNIFGDVYICGIEPAKSPSDLTEAQLVQYKEAPSIGVNGGNPMDWWRKNEKCFPIIAKLAKMYLCIPGTSVPSERVFSTAGDILNAQRANLKSKHLDRLIFLKKNLEKK